MHAFLNRLRSQKADKTSIPFSQPSSSSSNQASTEQTTDAPPSQFDGVRKIHPNQDELLSTSSPEVSKGSTSELGMRVPSALARVANRKVTPTGVEETIRESSELQRPEEIPTETGSTRKQSSSLFSAVPFSGATGWSTFGRSQKENTAPLPEDRPAANARNGATVSRTSSQSRTTTTATRTPPTKSSGLSRSNSAKLSRNNSTKQQPASSSIEQSSYSRIPLVPSHDIHENIGPRRVEGEASPSTSQHTPSSPGGRPSSVFNTSADHPHEHTIDGTYPPRTTVPKNPEPAAASSLPFTFGRQPPARPLAEDAFTSEMGIVSSPETGAHQNSSRRSSANLVSKAATSGGNQWPSAVTEEILRLSLFPQAPSSNAQAFPLVETPTSEQAPPNTHFQPRTHLISDTSTISEDNTINEPHRVPSLISDTSNLAPSSSQGTGRGWTPDLPLRGMASFGSSGDELTNPRGGSSWTNPSDTGSRFEVSPRVRQASDERRRIRTGSGSSSGFKMLHRRASSDKPMGILKAKNQSLPAFGALEPITVFPVTTTSSQEFPKQGQGSQPAAGAAIPRTPTTSVIASDPSNPSGPPVVAVTAPTPRPSPARSRSASNRLTDLFVRDALRIPEGHAHASGIGVVGVETHSRRQSLKVTGKRKAGESEDEHEIVVNDERGHRPRFDSNAPSSYHRKRLKLSSNASEKDAAAARASRAASGSGAPSTGSFESSRPNTAGGGLRRPLSRNASALSVPISAIVTPRAPSVRHSFSGTSRRSDGYRYHDPLRNRNSRNQRRRKRETWADSWILDRDEMPVQTWLFLLGFILPLFWWAALFIPVRKGGKGKGPATDREAGADKSGSGLWVDQAQYDEELARLWRGRCLVAAIVSLFIYVPIIACAVVFSKR
ncbi:hypothetical protein M408DRAFT_331637 [Serendipita vermifera MAFF 305830]|uniref:Uncharacterized protein n=1 Tax=Serendipita vermifera MAFF 305830 TaxID=933852 RepID=A0A0C3AXF2_SERVB|nr:hypothetical protein M408DRAFT_331637 [Serendipita vermifera MAFF 305830]